MKTVTLKLPYPVRDKWRNSKCKILKRFNRRTRFIDTVTFIEHQFKIVSGPISRDIQSSQLCTISKNVNIMKSQMKPICKGTTVTATETPSFKESRKSNQVQR